MRWGKGSRFEELPAGEKMVGGAAAKSWSGPRILVLLWALIARGTFVRSLH